MSTVEVRLRAAIARDDLPEWQPKWKQLDAPVVTSGVPMMERLYQRIGVTVSHRDGTQVPDKEHAPRYNMAKNDVILPPVEAFESKVEYQLAAFHELTHWTGHPQRILRIAVKTAVIQARAILSRDESLTVPQEIADMAHYHEEMVAEVGALLLAKALRVPVSQEQLERAATYIRNYLRGGFHESDWEPVLADVFKEARKATAWLLYRNVMQEAA